MGVVTNEELDEIRGLDSALDWAGVKSGVWGDMKAQLGGSPDLKAMAFVPKNWILNAMRAAQLSPIECTQVAMLWRVARQKYGQPDEDPLKDFKMSGQKETVQLPAVQHAAGKVEQPGVRTRLRPPDTNVGIRGTSYTHGMEDFASLLKAGTDCALEVPRSRWDHSQFYNYNDGEDHGPLAQVGSVNTRHGIFVEGIEAFNYRFFGLSSKEAWDMKPQQRFALKAAHRAFMEGDLTRHTLNGAPVAVFSGTMNYDAFMMHPAQHPGDYYSQDMPNSYMATRVSHSFGLRGPCNHFDTGCSSSLVCAANSMGHVLHGSCSASLAIGANALLSPCMFQITTWNKMQSAIGRTQSFDNRADGYCRGEGYSGVLIGWIVNGTEGCLLRDSSAVMHDGRAAQFTAPSGPSQQSLLKDCLRDARLHCNEISMLECAANGSALGDPIEVGAVKAVHSQRNEIPLVCMSAKANKGHSEGNAGGTGLCKLVVAMRHMLISPQIHFKVLNQYADVEGFPGYFYSEGSLFEPSDNVFHGAVSSFGYGGVNAHIILRKRAR